MNDRDASPDGTPNGGPQDEDALWRAIVDNYGERPELAPDEPTATSAPPVAGTPDDEPDFDDLERFSPPEPPPLTRPEPPALIAWAGVLVAPLLLIVRFTFLPGLMPTFTTVVLVVWFLGGFGYLVSAMPNEPPDPFDDGARL